MWVAFCAKFNLVGALRRGDWLNESGHFCEPRGAGGATVDCAVANGALATSTATAAAAEATGAVKDSARCRCCSAFKISAIDGVATPMAKRLSSVPQPKCRGPGSYGSIKIQAAGRSERAQRCERGQLLRGALCLKAPACGRSGAHDISSAAEVLGWRPR